jgi:hypothetical protein
MGGRCLSGSSGVLTVGKGSDILHMGDNVIPAVGGGILGTCNGGGLNHVAIFDLPALGAFMTAAPLLCTHKDSHWSLVLLPGHRSTPDLTHHERPKMLLYLSESGWGLPISGWGQSEQEE